MRLARMKSSLRLAAPRAAGPTRGSATATSTWRRWRGKPPRRARILQPGAFKLPDGTAGEVTGQGPPLILLHGIGLDRSMWQAQVYYFSHSYSVVRYDL